MDKAKLEFDGEAAGLVEAAFRQAESAQSVMHDQYQRDWLLYKAYRSQLGDADMPNLSLPKMYAIVESKTPQIMRALYGMRPYIPFVARRKEYRETARVQQDFFDELIHRAGFYVEAEAMCKMSVLYGTAYQNLLPFYELTEQPVLMQDPVNGFRQVDIPSYRLRARLETWGPWDVMVDPMAKGLENSYDCRYVIKVQMTTVREIKEMAARGSYPNLDIEELDWLMANGGKRGYSGYYYGLQPFGRQMMAAYGLPYPQYDDDACLILRFESNDRYITSLNGDQVISDGPNPFTKMREINLSRMIHVSDPHSTHRFYGQGEAKINEVLIAMYNDLWRLTFSSHGIGNQPMIFFRKNAVNKEDLVWGLGQRVPIRSDSQRPISDDVLISSGNGLPRDHYLLPDSVARAIDETAANYPPNRGDAPGSGTTATAIMTATDINDERAEASVMLREQVFNTGFQRKGTAVLAQFANFLDLAEIVGQRDAMIAFTSNPNDLPGGHNIVNRGSDRMASIMKKRAALNESIPLLNPKTTRPGGPDRLLLRMNDFSEDEINELVLTPEEVEMMQRMELQLAMAAAQNNNMLEQQSAKESA